MDVHHLLSDMARELQGLEAPAAAIERIAEYANVAVGGDESGILLQVAGGRLETPASSSPRVTAAHQLQVDFDEGPCVAAIRGGDPVYVTGDTRDDPRWPRWGRAVADMGFQSVVSVSLRSDQRTFGSLNAYSRRVQAFDEEALDVMELLGVHASVAYASLHTAHTLKQALGSRTVIGQAQGIVMVLYGLDAELAFQYIRRISQHNNVRLVEVCRQIVAERGSATA